MTAQNEFANCFFRRGVSTCKARKVLLLMEEILKLTFTVLERLELLGDKIGIPPQREIRTGRKKFRICLCSSS